MDAEDMKTDAEGKETAKAPPKPAHKADVKAEHKADVKAGHKAEAKPGPKPQKAPIFNGSRIMLAGCILCIGALAAVLLAWPAGDAPHDTAPNGQVSGTQGNSSGGNGTAAAESNQTGPYAYGISFTTDKKDYYSKQTMNLTAKVIAPVESDDVEVWFFGIRNRYGADKVMVKLAPDLVPGENTVTTLVGLPACYGCSGIKPGNYTIHAGVYAKDNTPLANASTWIMMKQ